MTVGELIEKLRACNPGAPVVLHDPDTGLFLPLNWGPRNLSYEKPEDAPKDAVVVSADYANKSTT